ncbi:ATP-binding protein [Planococcus beijingensis]|uniref:ATP-binding protein n=1 Tax=Planococcus beijingensis TaxID=2782551 RepID=UPI00193C2D53|nr:ATP-binding protein [Planococcus beijingensis]
MRSEVIEPNVSNFVNSLRDMGYTFPIAIADIIDNSITANAKNIDIFTTAKSQMQLSLLDDGVGMNEEELVEAMRLATKSPGLKRKKTDLGKYGLGLKTASFSQCKKLTVISKIGVEINARQWDLDYISAENKWLLLAPEISSLNRIPLFEELTKLRSGTLIVWENIDGIESQAFSNEVIKLRDHLALVFHRFIEGIPGTKILKININNNIIKPFNPFNPEHPASQQLSTEKIKIKGENILVQPFILPHHSKVSQAEYEKYATDEGYTRSQGFYLYRANRLLIYGTWWKLHKSIDAHKLVRIKIDIPNDQDQHWGIDIKKSTASPGEEIKKDLKRIISQVTEIGSRPYTGRGRKIEDKTVNRFWSLSPLNGEVRFTLNTQHPLLNYLKMLLDHEEMEILDTYLKGIQAFLPLDAIQSKLQQSPHEVNQKSVLTNQELEDIINKLKSSNLDESMMEQLLNTEIFKEYRRLKQ